MVYFPPQQNNKNGINLHLLGVDEGWGRTRTPKLNYSTGRGRNKKKKRVISLTNQLYYHYTCYIPTAPNITSPPPGMETLQVANLCMCAFKFQIIYYLC